MQTETERTETEQTQAPPSTPVTPEVPPGPEVPPSTPIRSEARRTFQDLRSRFNAVLDEITRAAPEGAVSLAAVRCGGGCHQGVIE